MIDKERLAQGASEVGIRLDDQMLERFARYAELLAEWNEKINLTAITQPHEVEVKHFIDCLLLAACPEVAGTLADVGSGAGFPGLVVKIYRPEVAVTLIEPTAKRARFLQAVSDELGLEVTVVNRRAEEVGRKQLRERFDCVTARAVAAMGVLAEYCLPLAAVGGSFIAMKGGEEPPPGAPALQKLGGAWRETRNFTLPDGAARRLVVVAKTAPTPPQYPRNGGVIAKRPL